MIHSPSVFDTEETTALREQINHLERQESERRREWDAQHRERKDRYEALLLAQRPTYPTPEHLAAFERIATMVREGTEYGDHHGHPRHGVDDPLPRGVLFESKGNRINVMATAPYRVTPPIGGRLWSFTEEEIAAMRADLEVRHGLTIVTDWSHDDGHAFRVIAKSTI